MRESVHVSVRVYVRVSVRVTVNVYVRVSVCLFVSPFFDTAVGPRSNLARICG